MKYVTIILLILVAAGAFYYYTLGEEACIQVVTPARNRITGTVQDFPTPCDVPFWWEIIEQPGGDSGDEPFVSENVRVSTPLPNSIVTSPLTVRGQARGTWYFEASFPVRILDANGTELGVVPAQAQGEWMTTEFVPFEAVLIFSAPTGETGTLVFEKDNPSGLPEHADFVSFPVRFNE